MTSVIGVRRATAADVGVLVELMREFYAEADFPLDSTWAGDAFADLVADPSLGAVWIISVNDAPVGHVVLTVRYAMEFGGLIGYIDDLFVRKVHRRQGAATAGLDALVAECKRRGCKSIHVEVGPGNIAAIGLYGRFGLAPGTDERVQLKVQVR